MAVPIEFLKLVQLFLQDSDEDAQSVSEFVALAVELLDPADAAVAKAYIEEVLDSGMDEGELDELWKSCHPNYWIEKEKMREFFLELHNQLGKVVSEA